VLLTPRVIRSPTESSEVMSELEAEFRGLKKDMPALIRKAPGGEPAVPVGGAPTGAAGTTVASGGTGAGRASGTQGSPGGSGASGTAGTTGAAGAPGAP
jgi:hypothetical protein